ncbi:MAG: uroporphyrinogen decarboxylase family protein, partial [Pseudomonadota bacterium]
LQPIKRFDFDAAIIFSDILTIPQAMGQKITFIKGHGPKVSPFDISILDNYCHTINKLSPVYDAINLTRSKLDNNKSLIGFSGGAWTLLYYILGNSKEALLNLRVLAYKKPTWFIELTEALRELITSHLIMQIEAGCDIIQIFESWSDTCPVSLFNSYIVELTMLIVNKIKLTYPHITIIGFPRGCGNLVRDYLKTDVDVMGIDWQQPLSFIANEIQPKTTVQGCLDPAVLLTNHDIIAAEVAKIGDALTKFPFIFNLGHGITPKTPIENVEFLVKEVRKLRWHKK